MNKISDHIGAENVILQPSIFKRVFELRSNGELLATMTFPRLFSSTAEVDIGQQKWEIYKPSIWKSVIEIRPAGYQMPTAKYIGEKWKQGGTIELPMGGRLKFGSKRWKDYSSITSESGKELVSFHRKGFFGTSVIVELHEQSEVVDKNPWVIMLVSYLRLQQEQQSAPVH